MECPISQNNITMAVLAESQARDRACTIRSCTDLKMEVRRMPEI
jgi:hypothetical protein